MGIRGHYKFIAHRFKFESSCKFSTETVNHVHCVLITYKIIVIYIIDETAFLKVFVLLGKFKKIVCKLYSFEFFWHTYLRYFILFLCLCSYF